MTTGQEVPLHHRVVQDVSVPAFLYGTAWKEDGSEALARLALATGFRGIDTANQRRHYVEAAVGDAVAAVLRHGKITRQDVFLQTKFTYARGQDHRMPYDRAADHATQVDQSFQSSLEHLQTTYVDSYVLHGPSSPDGLSDGDWSVWRAMEDLHQGRKARLLGVSNVSLEQLRAIHEGSRVKPAFVQNRCFASTGWDRATRAFCELRGIVYQGFSLLTANGRALKSPAVTGAARRAGRTPAQVIFRFALQLGMIPLTGTKNPAHMREDLECFEFELDPAEVRAIEECGAS